MNTFGLRAPTGVDLLGPVTAEIIESLSANVASGVVSADNFGLYHRELTEIVVDPDMLDDTGDGWTGVASTRISGGLMNLWFVASGTVGIAGSPPAEIGATYEWEIVIDMQSNLGNGGDISFGGVTFASAGLAVGTHTGSFVATSTDSYLHTVIFAIVRIDRISIKKVTEFGQSNTAQIDTVLSAHVEESNTANID